MINEARADVLAGDKEKASTDMHRKITAYIHEFVFGDNNTNWAYWLLPLNVIILSIIIASKLT